MIRPAAIWAVVAFALASCASVQSNYTKFDNLPGSLTGTTVVFYPYDEQVGSAQWEAYARKVAARLAGYGVQRIEDIRTADYAAFLSYGTGDTRTTSGSMPIFGQTGGGTSTFSGTIYGGGSLYGYSGSSYTQPTYGVTGYIPYTVSQTDKFFSVRLIDMQRSTQDHIVAAYEGSVISSGTERSFPEVADCMIGALLENFRGSGTDEITMYKDDC